jgi:hypothetical protein
MSKDEMNYILEAICMIGQDGWKLLPLYRYNHKTGEWKHHSRFTKFPGRKWLSSGLMSRMSAVSTSASESSKPDMSKEDFNSLLDMAKDLLCNPPDATQYAPGLTKQGDRSLTFSTDEDLSNLGG